jgi:hypothetical protein
MTRIRFLLLYTFLIFLILLIWSHRSTLSKYSQYNSEIPFFLSLPYHDIPQQPVSSSPKRRRRRRRPIQLSNQTKYTICRSCRRTYITNMIHKNWTCEKELNHRMAVYSNQTTTTTILWPIWLRTMIQIAKENGDCRQECHPSFPRIACRHSMIQTQYHGLGFDQVAPTILRSVSPTLSSVTEAMLSPNTNISGGYPLYTYNPTILPYSATMYLVTFRVSTATRLSYEFFRNYMGLAILDENLNILSNVLLDINRHLGLLPTGRGYYDYKYGYVDFRIFHLNGTYVLSDSVYALPIRILLDNHGDNDDDEETKHKVIPLFGSGLTIVPLGDVRTIPNIFPGKNFQFVEVEKGGDIFLEEWPLSARKGEDTGRYIGQLEFSSSLIQSTNYTWNPIPPDMYQPNPALEGDEEHLRRSPWRCSGNRGTACCISLEKTYYADLTANLTILSYSHLLIGIAHVKSFKKLSRSDGRNTSYGYLSRWYAILPTIPPTHVAAQSGLFCWPFTDAAEIKFGSQLSWLEWKNRTYHCPDITFASGLTVSLSNASNLMVGYGINDEVPLLAEITKRDVALRLFSPLPIV